MAGFKAADNITGWIKGFFRRKDDKLEKDTGKAVMSGDESTFNRVLNKLYKPKK
jgi:hypothetical protein